jgi:xanthine dehydrogenase YagR molybdenum-binding subunit
VVLAESFEAAREAAHRLEVTYVAEEPSAGFDSAGVMMVAAKEVSSNYEDPAVGDAAAAPANGLTVWEGSQNVMGVKNGLAEQLGIDPEKIRVVSPLSAVSSAPAAR